MTYGNLPGKAGISLPPGPVYNRRHPFRGPEDARHDEASWLISLSDIMSLLLIFFLAWTALEISRASSLENHSEGRSTTDGLEGTLLHEVTGTVIAGNICLVLDEKIAFDEGKATLTPNARHILARVAQVLRKRRGYVIDIIGHSDSVPVNPDAGYGSNYDLSLDRAVNVYKEFVSFGLDPGVMRAQGLGSLYGLKENDSDAHRRANRRVEIVIRPSKGNQGDVD